MTYILSVSSRKWLCRLSRASIIKVICKMRASVRALERLCVCVCAREKESARACCLLADARMASLETRLRLGLGGTLHVAVLEPLQQPAFHRIPARELGLEAALFAVILDRRAARACLLQALVRVGQHFLLHLHALRECEPTFVRPPDLCVSHAAADSVRHARTAALTMYEG